ncbi:MAG: hypothetical protein GEV07_20265 [Streptosporangiales bacterium]|nr:hypothetical protein [Streptosporangiales bacterium]
MKTEPASSAVPPTSEGLGAGGPQGEGCRSGFWSSIATTTNPTTTNPTTVMPDPTNCGMAATKSSFCSDDSAVSAAPSVNTTAVTVMPIRPSHGVVLRVRARISTSAMGTLMLHTVCRVRTKSVHQPPMPSAGMCAGWSSRRPA